MNKGLPVLLTMTILSGIALSSTLVSADNNEVIDTVELTVPVACTMSGTGTTHTATLNPGTYSAASGSDYEAGIGKTTLTAICNDDNGFSIYAIGFTGNQYEGENHTKLIGTNTNGTIATKAYASGDTTSNWSMKLTKVTNPGSGDPVTYNPENLTITTNYDNWIAVPATYTKVAQYKANTGSSTTDTTLGVKLETTYAAYIASNQAADTYVGQVKYTMVHPYNETPTQPMACQEGKICYYPNSALIEGTMGQYTLTATDKIDWSQCYDTDLETYCYDSNWDEINIEDLPDNNYYSSMLLASNYSRDGYGFAGWSDTYDYETNPNAHFYGPQETITVSEDTATTGLSLYAVWVKSQGSLQDSTKVSQLCGTGTGSLTIAPTNGTADLSSVSALTDQRDNQTYAIAKLADGKCWMIENLRLEAENTRSAEDIALAQGYGTSTTYGDFSGLADAESTGFSSTYSANSLYSNDGSNGTINIGTSNFPGRRMPRYNNLNTQSRANNPTSNEFTDDNTTGGIYSYGNYYTWHAAIADTAFYGDDYGASYEFTSLCPSGWRLPVGSYAPNVANYSFGALSVALGGPENGETAYSYDSTPTGIELSKSFRSYPNNFIYSGRYNNNIAVARGKYGYYWTSVSKGWYTVFALDITSFEVSPGNISSNGYKHYGQSIRCAASI